MNLERSDGRNALKEKEICFVVIVTCMLTVCKMHLMKR
mgnify:FL=1